MKEANVSNNALAYDTSQPNEGAAVPGETTALPESHARAITESTGEDHSTRSEASSAPSRARSSRINPDDPKFIRMITLGVAFAGLVAFAISFVTLMEVASWLGLPRWMNWSVPAFIDTGILVYAGSVLIHKTRGERTWPSWMLLGAFTALSVVANASHALTFGTVNRDSWQAIIGAVIAGMVPLAVFAATEQLSRVAVEDPLSRRKELQVESEWLAAQAERERRQLEVEAERERAWQENEIAREQHVTQLEVVRAQREALTTQAAQAVERGEDFALPQSRSLASAQRSEPQQSAAEEPTPARRRPAKPSGDGMDEIGEFIAKRTAEGQNTSGADLASAFGFSDKTGRRRLNALREDRPDIFLGETELSGDGA